MNSPLKSFPAVQAECQGEFLAPPVGIPSENRRVVLHVRVVTGEGGGPEKTILNSPRFLAQNGYQGICAYMHPPEDPGFEFLRRRADQWEAPLVSIADRGILDISLLYKLWRVCRDHRVSIWHAHDYKSNLIGLALRPFWKMKLVTTAHGWVKFTKRTPLYYWIDRRCQRRYEKVICVSEEIRDQCIASGVPAEKCIVIYNAIDADEFRRTRTPQQARKDLNIPERMTIGGVGRLSSEKGFDLLIRATGDLIRAGKDVQLILAGEGDARRGLEELIVAEGLQERVRLLGHRDDLSTVYQAMDLFVLSSLREGLPNVLLEAMAYELPIVATRVGAVPLVLDSLPGLVASASQHELYRAMERFLSEPSERIQFGKLNRVRVSDRFSFSARMARVVELYQSLDDE